MQEKEDKVQKVINDLQKKYEKEVIGYGLKEREVKSTGSLLMDYFLNGGIERGTISTFYGRGGSAKTTFSIIALAEAQKRGDICAWIRIEKGCNAEYMQRYGIDMEKLIIVENLPHGEAYIDAICSLLNVADYIVIDSLTALEPKQTIEESSEKNFMMVKPRLISEALSKINTLNKDTIIIMISQLREKPNPMGLPLTVHTGGRAVEHYSDYMVEFKPKAYYDVNGIEIAPGNLKKEATLDLGAITTFIYVKKTRRGVPHRCGEIFIDIKNGKLDETEELIKVSERLELIEVNRGWIKYNDKNIRPTEFKNVLLEDKVLYETFKNKILLTFKGLYDGTRVD